MQEKKSLHEYMLQMENSIPCDHFVCITQQRVVMQYSDPLDGNFILAYLMKKCK